jgi:hypothetical protein
MRSIPAAVYRRVITTLFRKYVMNTWIINTAVLIMACVNQMSGATVGITINWTGNQQPNGPSSGEVYIYEYAPSGGSPVDHSYCPNGPIGASDGNATSGMYVFKVDNATAFPITGTYSVLVNNVQAESGSFFIPPPTGTNNHSYKTIAIYGYLTPDPANVPQHGPARPGNESADPIVYSNGDIDYKHDDLVSGAAGGWGLSRSFSNDLWIASNGAPQPFGPGWQVDQMPYIEGIGIGGLSHFLDCRISVPSSEERTRC